MNARGVGSFTGIGIPCFTVWIIVMNNRRHYTPEASIPSPHVQFVYDSCREVMTPRSRLEFSHFKFHNHKETSHAQRHIYWEKDRQGHKLLVMKIPFDSFPWPGSTASEKISGHYFW